MDSPKPTHYYNYYYATARRTNRYAPQPPGKHRRHHWRRRLFGLLVLLIIAGGGYGYLHHHDHMTVQVTAASAKKPAAVSLVKKTAAVPSANLAVMERQINSIISANSDIDVSVSVTDLGSAQHEHFGDSGTFDAASVGKLITAADFLHQVEAGDQTLSETINGATASYELQQMIVVSDDNAWEALNNQLTYENLEDYATSLGLTSYNAEPNTISSDDIATLLTKLYDGQLLKSSDTNLLLSWMKQANYRTFIVPAVPSSDTIYHKVGLYEDFVNDAAIITNGKQAVVLVIFTNGNGVYNWTARAQMMQQITKAVLGTYIS